jgi:protein-S-isoprenylcysteine O-methyltransferase Ste14
MSVFWAKLVWCLGVIGWYAIRYPHDRRSRRTPKRLWRDRRRDFVLLIVSASGMLVVPAVYVFAGWPQFADYPLLPPLAWLGAGVFACALWLFYRTHKDLGRNWSVTLEIRDRHALITSGIYRHLRHPMYAAFWLWAVAQALLLPNWIAGPAGIVGFGTLYFLRVGREEKLMLEMFQDEYRHYMARTGRIVPRIY